MNKNDKLKKGKERVKKVINIIEYVIVFTVILVNTILIFQSVFKPNKTPNIFGNKAFVIVSGSMIPEINIGDIVFARETNNLNSGDIIAFRKESSVIVHRIVKEMDINGEAMFQTKGDNNNIEDKELVRKSTIEGVVFGKIPYIGNILMYLYNHLLIVIIVMIAFLIIKLLLIRK